MYANIYVSVPKNISTSVKEEKSVSCFAAIREVSPQSLLIDKQFVTIRWWKYVKINYRIVIFAFIIRRRRLRRWYPNRLFINIPQCFKFVSSGVASQDCELQIGLYKATLFTATYHFLTSFLQDIGVEGIRCKTLFNRISDNSSSHWIEHFIFMLRYWLNCFSLSRFR